ncbi:IS3 family transposase [Parachitinimonas caeni]|uniref:IS3 family transposase n=1 Tax=Parachitinimonas caeni TaxID=3031301 RepID=A0ABT7E1N5_9NEIS|nr:IS3 family transposase [Parachitinimonas caeni]MDK2126231.1 IS3 family transposase [Parachitinimonas caeni]
MLRYTEERKEAVLKKLLPPINRSVAAVSREEGISGATLYNWRNQAKAHGVPVPGEKPSPDDWSAEAKFAVVIETAALSEIELSEYCRRKGLYVEQVHAWRQACIEGQQSSRERQQAERAEAAALLVLRKKFECLLERRQRGRMTSLPDRQKFVAWYEAAVTAGARRQVVCAELTISLRTMERWIADGVIKADARTTTARPCPVNALTPEERAEVLAVCNSAEFASLPPGQIVPRLADRGRYLASESTFYRVLRAANQQNRRGRSQPPRHHAPPATHVATGPRQVWSWDITYLPSSVRGKYYYLYLIEDLYSRKTVGWEVHEQECGSKAAVLLQRTTWRESCLNRPLVLHSDNGAPMKSATLLNKMYELGVVPSRGRPRVSNDNPYSESLFRTLKYCPQWPAAGFSSLEAARTWVHGFVEWYNQEHRHSRIRFVTPAERHEGKDKMILAKRHELYQAARQRHPERWSRNTRNWQIIGAVTLNPQQGNDTERMTA